MKIINKVGLINVFSFSEPGMRRQFELMSKEVQNDWDEEMGNTLQELEQFCRSIDDGSFDDDPVNFSQKLVFREVSEQQSNTKVDQLVQDATINGGKSSKDASVGICVDDGHKIIKYINDRVKDQDNLVLYVYDRSKLRRLSEEEKSSDIIFAAGYGVKPKDGLKLSDTLLGTMVLEAKNPETK